MFHLLLCLVHRLFSGRCQHSGLSSSLHLPISLGFQLFLGLHTMSLLLLLADPLWGLGLGLLLLPEVLLFDWSGRVQGFLEHDFLFHLLGSKSLHQLWLLRCFLQGMLHPYTRSIVFVDMYVFYELVLGFLLPFWVFLGIFLSLFLGRHFLLHLGCRGWGHFGSFHLPPFFLVCGLDYL